MATNIVDSKPALTASDLDDLERRLSIKLPDDYRQFLIRQNGGRPVSPVFTFVESSRGPTDSSVAWFLSVHQGKYSNFEKDFRNFKVVQRRMPDNLVPIAHDPFGNEICMSFSGDDRGAIYFWDHESEADEGEEPTYNNCYLIAKSLTEFLDGLHE